ncbi:MAG: hypothetical protein NT163_00110 [Chlorobiales bacterium]|nr:hypothetical protein [Chlorobiales bacterium]
MSLIAVIKGIISRTGWNQNKFRGNQPWTDVDMHAPLEEDPKPYSSVVKEKKQPNKSFDEILSDKIAFFESLPSLK